MAKLVDAADLKSADGDVVGVQVPLPPSPQRLLAWAHAGLSFTSAGRPSRRLHVYGADWDLLPSGYLGVL